MSIMTWNLIDLERGQLEDCLENLRESGASEVVILMNTAISHSSEFSFNQDVTSPSPTNHQMYHLVCTDPDGEWFWLNDPDDTGWLFVKRNPLNLLHYVGHDVVIVATH